MKNINYSLFFYLLLCIILFYIIIIKWGNYIIKNYLKEPFYPTISQEISPKFSHTVDLPINTTYSCNNFCGPASQCSISRQQCTSDVDCYGCQPIIVQPPKYNTKDIRGQNDAGRLTYNQNPQYSELTTDIGTQASLYGDKYSSVPTPYLGVDKWMKSANVGIDLENDQLKYIYSAYPSSFINIPTYPTRNSITGLFKDNGPLAANAYL
jgi:hypothetical protein